MKTNATKNFVIRIIPFVSLSLSFLAVFSQPAYTFKGATLESGSGLSLGAVYRFSGVKTGTDAKVTIKAMTGGITLSSIDENWTGFEEAFQPFINVSPNSSGYVEFQVDFVSAGTNTPNNQATVPLTCIDVDGVTYGDGVLYEQDQVQFFPGYYNYTMTGLNLQITNPSNWVVIKNTSGATYSGIDTIAKDVMATVVNQNISSFLLRVGAINTSPTKSEVRYRSVYFKTFSYPSPFLLPNRTLLRFSGTDKSNGVELKGNLSASHSYDKILVERGISPSSFFYVAELPITDNTAEFPFTYLDFTAEAGVNYYRLRLVNTTQRIQEISSILMVKRHTEYKDLRLNNSILLAGDPILAIYSNRNEDVLVQAADMSGRVLYNQKLKLNTGVNNISMLNFSPARGYIVVLINSNNKMISQKMIVQ